MFFHLLLKIAQKVVSLKYNSFFFLMLSLSFTYLTKSKWADPENLNLDRRTLSTLEDLPRQPSQKFSHNNWTRSLAM